MNYFEQKVYNYIQTHGLIEPGNRLHLRLQGKGVFGEGKDRTYGTLMHRILSQIETLDRVDDTIAAFVRSGELSESESKSIREDINLSLIHI